LSYLNNIFCRFDTTNKTETMKLDSYKQAVVDSYTTTNNNLLVSAGPGTGKSFLLKQIAKLTPRSKTGIYLAFANDIVKEMAGSMPEHIKVSTIHSQAYGILLANTKCTYKVDANKYFGLGIKNLNLGHIQLTDEEKKKYKTRDKIKAALERKQKRHLFEVQEIANLARLNMTERSPQNINELADTYGIDTDYRTAKHVLELLNKADEMMRDNARFKVIDFADMLHFTYNIVRQDAWPKYHNVMIDEAQDMNPLQKEIAFGLRKSNGRFIAVGDEKQAIYSFQGSNLDSFNAMREIADTTTLPLNLTYRMSKAVVSHANMVFDGLETVRDEEGMVKSSNYMNSKSGDYILCRNNKPLIDILIDLLNNGKKASILGKAYGVQLSGLASSAGSLDGLSGMLFRKQNELKAAGINFKTNKGYQQLKEKVDILESLSSRYGGLYEASKAIKTIFTDTRDDISLMTIHKSKGLQADNVYYLDSHLVPSEYAKTDLELYQEKCLDYVARTRAKNNLYYCESPKNDNALIFM